MSKTLLITMLALFAAVTAEPYISPLSTLPFYGSAFSAPYTSAVVPGAAPAVLPATIPYPGADVAAAYTSYGSPYGSVYGFPSLAPLAGPYPTPTTYVYGSDYVYGR